MFSTISTVRSNKKADVVITLAALLYEKCSVDAIGFGVAATLLYHKTLHRNLEPLEGTTGGI